MERTIALMAVVLFIFDIIPVRYGSSVVNRGARSVSLKSKMYAFAYILLRNDRGT
jgi:hypothetical protein